MPPVASHQSPAKTLFLCIFSAILLTLSFSARNIWICAWFGFLPLFFALENKSKPKAFFIAYLTGVFYWAGTVYWLAHVTLPGTMVLVLYLAVYFGIFGAIFSYASNFPPLSSIFILASVWVCLEYIRSYLFTGFPWALLGYSQYRNLPAIQIADITGAWGVSFIIMMVNVAAFQRFRRDLCAPDAKKSYLFVLACLFVICAYGYYRINTASQIREEKRYRICVVQANIPQELKWDPQAAPSIVDAYIKITGEALAAAPDIIIWPEAAAPGILGEDVGIFERIFSLSRKIKTPLLLGAVVRESDKYFNSALMLDSDARVIRRYDKLHLVPFGEYIPLKKVFPFLETVVPIGDIERGRYFTLFPVSSAASKPSANFAVLICFEDLFPELSRQFKKLGADFLVNITNDAWYKKSSAPYQHLQASVFRSVENRLYLARSANTGISGFIAPSGRIIAEVSDSNGRIIFVQGFKTEIIAAAGKELTFYSRFGDVFVILCIFFTFCGIIPLLTKKR